MKRPGAHFKVSQPSTVRGDALKYSSAGLSQLRDLDESTRASLPCIFMSASRFDEVHFETSCRRQFAYDTNPSLESEESDRRRDGQNRTLNAAIPWRQPDRNVDSQWPWVGQSHHDCQAWMPNAASASWRRLHPPLREISSMPEDDVVILRRVKRKSNWLEVWKQCPVPMDDLPPRSRELPKRRKL
jgi:hypothetical protein